MYEIDYQKTVEMIMLIGFVVAQVEAFFGLSKKFEHKAPALKKLIDWLAGNYMRAKNIK